MFESKTWLMLCFSFLSLIFLFGKRICVTVNTEAFVTGLPGSPVDGPIDVFMDSR